MWREETDGKNVYMGYCLFGLIILGEKNVESGREKEPNKCLKILKNKQTNSYHLLKYTDFHNYF